MIDLIPAAPPMAAMLAVQPVQQVSGLPLTVSNLRSAIAAGPSFAAVSGGRLLALGGIAARHEDCGVAWGVLSSGIGATMPALHRLVQRGLAASPHRRIEAYVLAGHREGARWIGLLGFEREGLMRSFHAGQDFELYALVR